MQSAVCRKPAVPGCALTPATIAFLPIRDIFMTTTPLPAPSDREPPRTTPVGAWWHTALLILIIVGISAYKGQPRFMAQASHFSTRIPIYLGTMRSEEHTSELQSPVHLVCRLLLEKKKQHTH